MRRGRTAPHQGRGPIFDTHVRARRGRATAPRKQAIDERLADGSVGWALVPAMGQPPVGKSGCRVDLGQQPGSISADVQSLPLQRRRDRRPAKGCVPDPVGGDAQRRQAGDPMDVLVGHAHGQATAPVPAGGRRCLQLTELVVVDQVDEGGGPTERAVHPHLVGLPRACQDPSVVGTLVESREPSRRVTPRDEGDRRSLGFGGQVNSSGDHRRSIAAGCDIRSAVARSSLGATTGQLSALPTHLVLPAGLSTTWFAVSGVVGPLASVGPRG